MHMKMKYSLTGNFSIILYNVKPVTVQSVSEPGCHMFGKDHCFSGSLIRKFINIGCMSFWQDQCMSL